MKKYTAINFLLLSVFLMTSAAIAYLIVFGIPPGVPNDETIIDSGNGGTSNTDVNQDFNSFKKFESEEEYKEYMQNNDEGYYGGSFGLRSMDLLEATSEVAMVDSGAIPKTDGGGPTAERVSETNVQVRGIDEADIVKTDGSSIFLSTLTQMRYFDAVEPIVFEDETQEKLMVEEPMQVPTEKTRILTAIPPENLETFASIDKNGEMLLNNDFLTIFGVDNIVYGYDVSEKSTPKNVWEMKIGERTSIETSRLFNDKIYIVLKEYPEYNSPCLIEPYYSGDSVVSIPCTEIYRPSVELSTDSIYTAMILNPETGEVENKITFVGSAMGTNVYMSTNALYVSYQVNKSMSSWMIDFFEQNPGDVFPEEIVSKISKIKAYDISETSKYTEMTMITEKWQQGLSDEEKERVSMQISSKMEEYVIANQREFTKTGIVKINVDDLEVVATSSVPGWLLNQFAMDEYEGNLRVATSVGDGMFSVGENAVNDVYILDENLEKKSELLDLGKGERIYSVRFMGETGYMVTFKQIDPFFVLDLADASNPEVLGELKIPGFSSYLHELEEGLVVGIGKEERKVKISLFDVSDKNNPQEVSKLILDDYWSDVASNHHAFLQDSDNNIFFMPAGKKGYVIGYENNELIIKKDVGYNAERALYLDNYLYITSLEYIVVLDESTWEIVNSYKYTSQ